MQCPYCQNDSQVVDSRATADGIRRRRVCADCRRRFTTYERLSPPSIRVTKRSGRTESFEAEKMIRVLERVCGDRSAVQGDDITRLARGIEAELIDQRTKIVASSELMRRLLSSLSELDPVAFRRLSADYLDESGRLRLGGLAAEEPAPQLDLFDNKLTDKK